MFEDCDFAQKKCVWIQKRRNYKFVPFFIFSVKHMYHHVTIIAILCHFRWWTSYLCARMSCRIYGLIFNCVLPNKTCHKNSVRLLHVGKIAMLHSCFTSYRSNSLRIFQVSHNVKHTRYSKREY